MELSFSGEAPGQEAATYMDRMGVKLSSAGEHSSALECFNESIRQNSSYVDSWVHRAASQKALKNYNSSKASLLKAVAADGRSAAAWSALADAYSLEKDYENGSAAAARIVEINPRDKAGWLKKGSLEQMNGDFASAELDLDSALQIDPNYKDALYRKALSCL